MAIAKKCDRCKKLYEPYNMEKRSEGGNGLIIMNRSITGGTYIEIDTADLCPDCYEGFNKWLSNPTTMVIFPESVLGRIEVDDNWKNRPQPDQYKITCDNSFVKSFEEDE